MNRIALECASNNYTVSQMISGLVLPIQVVHQPRSLLKKGYSKPDGRFALRQLRTETAYNAFSRHEDTSRIPLFGPVVVPQIVFQQAPSGVVVERQFFTRRPLLRALGGLSEGFVRAAVTIDDDAGPRSGTVLI